MPTARRALIAGLGLIGGSIGIALRRNGWHVAFLDSDRARHHGPGSGLALRNLQVKNFRRINPTRYIKV